jgi:hypothetical protein
MQSDIVNVLIIIIIIIIIIIKELCIKLLTDYCYIRMHCQPNIKKKKSLEASF